MTSLLSASGFEVTHERFGAGSDGYVTCYLDRGAFSPTFHLVRHPLDVLGSWETVSEFGLAALSMTHRAARWVAWNLRYESASSLRFRIEDIHGDWNRLTRALGRESDYPEGIPPVGQSEHDRPGWSDLGLMKFPVRRMSRRYGYEN